MQKNYFLIILVYLKILMMVSITTLFNVHRAPKKYLINTYLFQRHKVRVFNSGVCKACFFKTRINYSSASNWFKMDNYLRSQVASI